jgi:hypothetical protein
MTPPIARDVITEIKNQGYSRLDSTSLKNHDFSTLYKSFDRIIELASEPSSLEVFRAYDKTMECYLKMNDMSLSLETVSLTKLHKRLETHLSSFQYMHGYLDALKTNFDPLIHEFIVEMDKVSKIIFPLVIDLIPRHVVQEGVIGLLKASVYHNRIEGPYLFAPHYDITLLSVVLQTQNDGEEQLVLYPKSWGDALRETATEDSYRASSEDYPVVFCGMAGWKKMNIKPAAHTVENFSSPSQQKRRSLLFFLIPANPV